MHINTSFSSMTHTVWLAIVNVTVTKFWVLISENFWSRICKQCYDNANLNFELLDLVFVLKWTWVNLFWSSKNRNLTENKQSNPFDLQRFRGLSFVRRYHRGLSCYVIQKSLEWTWVIPTAKSVKMLNLNKRLKFKNQCNQVH